MSPDPSCVERNRHRQNRNVREFFCSGFRHGSVDIECRSRGACRVQIFVAGHLVAMVGLPREKDQTYDEVGADAARRAAPLGANRGFDGKVAALRRTQ